MIRKATADDAPDIARMGERFVSDTTYGGLITVDPAVIAATIGYVLSNQDGVVLVSVSDGTVNGMIAMLAYSHPFSGERMAFEVVWWVEPEARGDGIRLLKSAEEWAREQGVTKMQMVAPNERVGTLYKRLGYVAVETSYMRSL